jgi:hypothetical protein
MPFGRITKLVIVKRKNQMLKAFGLIFSDTATTKYCLNGAVVIVLGSRLILAFFSVLVIGSLVWQTYFGKEANVSRNPKR